MKKFRILVACEESQAVLKEILHLGHKDIMAYSCDIQPCSGGLENYHLQGDVLDYMNYFEWDMVIAFPPCTHLAVSGARYFEEKRLNGKQLDGIRFFSLFYNYPIKYKMIENPVNIIGGDYIKKYYPPYAYMRTADQYIQPYEYGDGYTKKTGLWLWNLPKLTPTNIVEEREQYCWKLPPSEDRAKLRSKTYPGIAKAIATQLVEYAYNQWKGERE